MAFKKPISHVTAPDSPDLLFRDLPRRKHASLYDHQGQILRNYVAQAMNASDVALQLPTGSGKTLVGLLLAEWRRRKNHERIVYLCPTRQLVNQVVEEASTKYGIMVEAFIGKAKDYAPNAKASYQAGERIAVTTYNSLFNTNPFFCDPEIIIIDDAHSAENYIAKQWTVHIKNFENPILFNAILAVLKGVISESDFHRMNETNHTSDDLSWVDKLPTDKLADISQELRVAIDSNIANAEERFAWSMIANHLKACQLYMSVNEILIRPLIPPTWCHAPFSNAKQRIFMSATLGSGGDLERLTGRINIIRLGIPEGWNRHGNGRRFFVFPEKSLNEDECKALRRTLMQEAGRSLVLTPNNELADMIIRDITETIKYPIFSAKDLETGRSDFVNQKPAVAIVANRYDGIDFPDDDCRLLFVEGLPRATNLQERFLMSRMGANILFNERIQTRILQAIGRCTRSLNDYSAVIVTGEDLPTYLTDRNRRRFFHPELQAELEFGINQSSDIRPSDIIDNFRLFLKHEEEWEDANDVILDTRNNSQQECFPAMDELSDIVKYEITWQKALWNQDYIEAYEAARDVLGGLRSSDLRGYRALWHYLAGSAAELAVKSGDISFETTARHQFSKAKIAANGIPWLISLARKKIHTVTQEDLDQSLIMLQIENIENQLQKLGTIHNRAFSAKENEIRDGINDGFLFEQAQVQLGIHLGFSANKKEEDASPDPWWMLGNYIIVFEDHANAKGTESVIDATKARQAASHPDWIMANVSGANDCTILPVLVTPAKYATEGALPHLNRVLFWQLDEFRKWAETGLVAIRDLRRTFNEPGDLAWRAEAAKILQSNGIDAVTIFRKLNNKKAIDFLIPTRH